MLNIQKQENICGVEVFDVSAGEGTFVNALGRNILHNTDG